MNKHFILIIIPQKAEEDSISHYINDLTENGWKLIAPNTLERDFKDKVSLKHLGFDLYINSPSGIVLKLFNTYNNFCMGTITK